ncbi:MAG: hypothetical protein ACI9FD_003729 [Gammaproteobacteria bacterium]|jgi:hypothetical protein
MKVIGFIVGLFLVLNVTGCSESSVDGAASSAKMDITTEANQKERGKFLAYAHRISVDLPEEEINPRFQKIIYLCTNDEKHQCTILHSSFNSRDHDSSNIELRIKPEGVATIIDLASVGGQLSNQSTDVEDLGDSIVDNQKRLEMLQKYRKRLEVLELKSANDVESLIKIASELSSVQSDLEYAEGKKAKLLQRVQMDIVNISLYSRNTLSFWDPIADAIGDFGSNLAEGISQAITAVAFLLPWLLILILLICVVRIIWRKTLARK